MAPNAEKVEFIELQKEIIVTGPINGPKSKMQLPMSTKGDDERIHQKGIDFIAHAADDKNIKLKK